MEEGYDSGISSNMPTTDVNGGICSRSHIWFIFALVALLSLTDALDSTIVNISAGPIGEDLGCDSAQTSLIMIAYTMPLVGFIVLFGKLFQTKHLKNILIAGLIGFTASSIACGLSHYIEVLVFWRFVQGLSAAAIASATPILIVRELPESETSMGLAIMAIMTGIATTLGPTLGDFIRELAGWRWIFFINVPICIVIIAMVFFSYKESKIELNKSMPDLSVCICYALATMTFVYAITELENDLVIPFVLLVISIIAGVFVYRHTMDDTKTKRIFNKTLLQNRDVILSTSSFICTTITASLISYLLPFYFRKCLGIDDVGLYFGASAAITILCSVFAGKWCKEHSARSLTIVAILCRIVFAAIFIIITPDMGLAPIFIGLAFMGVSFGFSGTAQPTRIIHHAAKQDKEDASNVMISANYIGASLGVALCVIVMFITVPGSYGTPIDHLTSDMVTSALHYCSIFSIMVNLIALYCTIKVNDHKSYDHKSVTQ